MFSFFFFLKSECLSYKRRMEDRYENFPILFEGSYGEAAKQSKEEFRHLVVFLHSSMHEDGDEFVREVLCHEHVVSYLNENCIFWSGSISSNEAYQLSGMLKVTSFPFLCMMIPFSNYEMRVVERIDKIVPPEELVDRFGSSMVLKSFVHFFLTRFGFWGIGEINGDIRCSYG